MKKLSILLAFVLVTSSAFTSVDAVKAKITLTPDEVLIPSTGEYVYLAKTLAGEYALFVSRNEKLYKRFAAKGDSVITIEGALFKPLQHYSKKQWKLLSKEVKLRFPSIAQKELESMKLYMIFNWGITPKEEVVVVQPNPVVGNNQQQKSSGGNFRP